MRFILGTVASLAILLVMAFILSKTVGCISNKWFRFVLVFALVIPFNFIGNYVNVWAFGYHEMSWPGALIIALLLATYGTFIPPQSHNSHNP
jgi:predicted Na+-dependent transporter